MKVLESMKRKRSRQIISIAVLLLIAILAFPTMSRLRNAIDGWKEQTFLRNLRIGMTRAELYRVARSKDLPLSNSNYVLWHDTAARPNEATSIRTKPGHHYIAVSQGLYPEPSRKEEHPEVSLFVDKVGGFMLWPYDRIDISFDSNDRVKFWNVSTSTTGL